MVEALVNPGFIDDADWDHYLQTSGINGDDFSDFEHAFLLNEVDEDTPVAEEDTAVFIGKGQSKNLHPEDRPGEGYTTLARLIGTKLHWIIANAGKTPEDLAKLEAVWLEKNEHYPAIVQLWSLAMIEAMDEFRALQPEKDGWTSEDIFEFAFSQDKSSAEAGQRIEQHIIDERAAGLTVGPVAALLAVNKGTLSPGQVDGKYDGTLKNLSQLLPEHIDSDVQDVRTHITGLDGKLTWLPTIRGDALRISYEETDRQAQCTAEALKRILSEPGSIDPNHLASTQYYGDVESKQVYNGFDVIYEAAQMMVQGRMKLLINEFKSKSLMGNLNDVYPIWTDHRGDIGSLLDSLPEHIGDPEYAHWQEVADRDEFDLVKTVYSMMNFFRIGLNGYYEQHGIKDAESFITLGMLMPNIDASYIWLGLDVRNGKNTSMQYITRKDYDNQLPYKTSPPISSVGYPEKVTLGIRKVPMDKIIARFRKWETNVYRKHRARQERLIAQAAMNNRVQKTGRRAKQK